MMNVINAKKGQEGAYAPPWNIKNQTRAVNIREYFKLDIITQKLKKIEFYY